MLFIRAVRSRTRRLLLLLIAGAAASVVLTAPASAAAPENGWTCRGQTVTVTGAGETPFQELTNLLAAGGEFQPCANVGTSPAGSALKPLTDALAVLGVKVGLGQADTAADTSKPTRDQTPTAHAKTTDVEIGLAGMQLLRLEAAESRVTARCVDAKAVFQTSSDVGDLTVFGQAVDLDGGARTLSQGIAGLETIVRLTPGARTDDPRFGTTVRALRIEVLQTVLGFPVSLLDLGVGVSNVTAKGDPCAAAVAPTVGTPTADGRTLSVAVTPPTGTTITRCAFAVTPAGGAPKTVEGLFDPATDRCTAVLVPSEFPAGGYTATGTATTSAGGVATGAASAPFTLTAPTAAAPAVLVPSLEVRTVAATVTPAANTTIASCRFVVTPPGGTPVAVAGTFADNRCSATLPRASFPPGSYTVAVSATASNGEVGESSGSGTIAGPVVEAPVAVGPLVGAQVRPGAGATVTGCTLAVRPAAGGPTKTIPGTYDAPTGGCAAILPPAEYPTGDYVVAVTVTDSAGDTATAESRVTVNQFVAPGPTPGGAAGPLTTADAGQALVACDGRKLALTDVVRSGSRVRVSGVAQKALAGQSVVVRFVAKGRSRSTVGRMKVAADGTWSGTVTAPPARFRTTKANGRYTASIGGSTTAATKLVRRMTITSVTRSGTTIRVSGRVAAPLPRTRQNVVLSRRTSCTAYRTVATVKASSTGRFTASFKAPADGSAGVYRASTKVPSKAGGAARNSTFTLPRIIAGK